jgi:hypothetical protein
MALRVGLHVFLYGLGLSHFCIIMFAWYEFNMG